MFSTISAASCVQRQFAIGVNFCDVPFAGLVDQLKIYDLAMPGELVAQLYAEGR